MSADASRNSYIMNDTGKPSLTTKNGTIKMTSSNNSIDIPKLNQGIQSNNGSIRELTMNNSIDIPKQHQGIQSDNDSIGALV